MSVYNKKQKNYFFIDWRKHLMGDKNIIGSDEMKQDSKPTNFRVRMSDVEKFRIFCTENGMNQADAFEFMVKAIELDKAKEAIPGKADLIDKFRHYSSVMIEMYLQSLDDTLEAEEKAQAEVARDLKSKDETIADLQEKNTGLRQKVEVLQQDKSTSEAVRIQVAKDAEETAKRLRASEATIADKQRVIDLLQSQVAQSSEKAEKYDALKKEYDSLNQQHQKDLFNAEKEKTAAVSSVRNEMQSQIDALKEQISAYQLSEQKYLSELTVAQKDVELAKSAAEREIREVYENKLQELRDKYDQRIDALLNRQ